ncbi:WD40 repeat-like protein [Basidiobolus meristosporus CBS 931.73]|uniref:WD40 repeat-like protein n=1 Tax=Basidiobolus meristosporus CBS 931.73 TaxID=1314790 RepID=A0A1Y1ZCN7_9FUNG|nr:WD40 repeat-like protein [Basidiobolus meristosporus CBS 931.73]|eukprot:ORY07976.1 WD40 repeat-like protein [Basidiobolus meristosporus CBS 931.73]
MSSWFELAFFESGDEYEDVSDEYQEAFDGDMAAMEEEYSTDSEYELYSSEQEEAPIATYTPIQSKLEKKEALKKSHELRASGEFGYSDAYVNPQNIIGRRRTSVNVVDKLIARECMPSYFLKAPVSKNYRPSGRGQVVAHYDSRPYSGQFSEDGTFFYACGQDFLVHIYDTTGPEFVETKVIVGETGRWTITDASLSSDNQWIIYSSISPVLYMAKTDPHDDTQHALDFGRDEYPGFGLWSIRFSGDAREIVAGASDARIYIYDVETRKVVSRSAGHEDEVNAVCFADPASTHVLFSGSDDSFVKVWDRRSMKGKGSRPAGALVGHSEGITFVASKGDGRYCLTNSKDQTMKLWDIRNMMTASQFDSSERLDFRCHWDYRFMEYPGPRRFRHPNDCSVMTYRGHRVLKTLIRCHFSPLHNTGQRYLYTGSEDGKVRVFNLAGDIVQTLNVGAATSRDSTRPISRRAVTRDVSWHPYLPKIVSTSWHGSHDNSGSIVQHQYTSATIC